MNNKFWKMMGLTISSLLIPFCASCNGANKDDGKLKIVTTIFPEYDWVMNIVGEKKDNMDITLLLNSGIDLHSYEPSVQDTIAVSKCDLFVYVGGESDEWVEDVLKQATNKDMKVINLMDTLGDAIKEEEIVEGMEGEDHEHEEGEEHEHEEEEKEYDEHVWLSLKNAQVCVEEISKSICALDVDNANYYQTQTTNYINALKDLDARYAQAVEGANTTTLLFGDRFPFRYLVDDYGLKYYAAFVGCSAESEASFETIKFLADKMDELNLKVIYKLESSDGRIAETIKNNTANKNQTILTMDSIQSASTKEYKNGRNYLSIMEQNLVALKEGIK